MSQPSHLREKNESKVDPDDGNSWSCSVCNLPIFSTPFIKSNISSKVIYKHDQRANLPSTLNGSVVHPECPLKLWSNFESPNSFGICSNCSGEICGTEFYYCLYHFLSVAHDHRCQAKYDVLCASTVRILHRSHKHRLLAIRGAGLTSTACGACGTRHDRALTRTDVSYLCNACSFWIHPDCAALPNAITLQHSEHHHQHPLVLNYYRYRRPQSSGEGEDRRRCAICHDIIAGLGAYSCTKCRDYYVHITCAVTDPQSFKPVLIREAQLPDLIRLPIPDENTSVVRYVLDSTSSISSDHHGDEEVLQLEYLHKHPLILHHHDDNDLDNYDDDDDDGRRVCNACAQFISPPFYRCSECPNFFLHNCCAHLPTTLTQHPTHPYKDHSLSFLTKHGGATYESMWVDSFSLHNYRTNGFIYSCENCDGSDLDVLRALMSASFTHDAHSTTHILYLLSGNGLQRCNCCRHYFALNPYYECRTCPNFRVDARCTLLPNTVRHKFDQHPLKLIATTDSAPVNYISGKKLKVLPCEVCERDIDNSIWYYSCNKCDQSFHVNCIPCLDSLSRIKFGVSDIRVEYHDCPLTLIRASTVFGYHCGRCGETFKKYHDQIAYECSKCDFRIHDRCHDK